MKIVKFLGALLLAVYLILVGIVGLGVTFAAAPVIIHLSALISGILILVALWLCHSCGTCHTDKHVE